MSTAVAKTIDFASLPFEEQKAHFFDVAKRALPLWGYPDDSEFKLLNITENATYLVTHEGYDKLIMRVHRMDYAEKDSIRTELAFINYLRENTDLNLVLKVLNDNNTIPVIVLDSHGNVTDFRNLSLAASSKQDSLRLAADEGRHLLALHRHIRVFLDEQHHDYIDVCYDESLMLKRLS